MLSRTGRVAVVVAALSLTFTAPRSAAAITAVSGHDLAAALAGTLELGWLALSSWVLLSTGLGSIHGAPGRLGRALLPAALRAALFTGIAGITLAGTAHADDAAWPLDGLRLPERATVVAQDSAPRAATTVGQDVAVTVRPGETLWSLSRAELGRSASDAAVAQRVAELHRHNRRTIGEDPDLIHPGQRLHLPETAAGAS